MGVVSGGDKVRKVLMQILRLPRAHHRRRRVAHGLGRAGGCDPEPPRRDRRHLPRSAPGPTDRKPGQDHRARRRVHGSSRAGDCRHAPLGRGRFSRCPAPQGPRLCHRQRRIVGGVERTSRDPVNNGTFEHSYVVPADLQPGSRLCDRGFVSGLVSGADFNGHKSNDVCFDVAALVRGAARVDSGRLHSRPPFGPDPRAPVIGRPSGGSVGPRRCAPGTTEPRDRQSRRAAGDRRQRAPGPAGDDRTPPRAS